jgi:hypothetical protein
LKGGERKLNKHLKFEVDNIEVLELKGGDQALFGKRTEDSQFAVAKIRAFSSGWNRHDMYCSEEVLKKTASTIFYKPLLYVFDEKSDDFGSHAEPEESRPAGFVFPDGAEFVRLGDGRLSLNVVVKIWKRYAPTVMAIFERDKGKKAVSVEMELLNFDQREDRSLNMLDFSYMAITILGSTIQEASPGANIEILSFSDEVEKFKDDVRSEFSWDYDDIDFSIPQEIKKNAKKGLGLYSIYGRADYSSLENATYISEHDFIKPEWIYSIYSVFNSTPFVNIKNSVASKEYISYLLHGGEEGKNWIYNLYHKINKVDGWQFYNFEKITFPYTNKENANPALKNWKPPLSLSQMNAIARRADAMIQKGDSEDSAWKIAISNFKKTHEIKNNQWVKKETEVNMTDEFIENQKKIINSENEIVENQEKDDKPLEELIDDEVDNDANSEADDVVDNQDDNQVDNNDFEKDEGSSEEEEDSDEESEEDEDVFSNKETVVDLKSIFDILSSVEEVQEFLSDDAVDVAKLFEVLVGSNQFLKNENKLLNEFKEKINQRDFNMEVSKTLSEIAEKFNVSEDDLIEMREESSEFSLDNIDQWKNQSKAKALDKFPLKESEKTGGEEIKRYGLNWLVEKESLHTSRWEKYLGNLDK